MLGREIFKFSALNNVYRDNCSQTQHMHKLLNCSGNTANKIRIKEKDSLLSSVEEQNFVQVPIELSTTCRRGQENLNACVGPEKKRFTVSRLEHR